ncbi:MAG: PKD domain-containing protein [Thermoanaerobaculia bacterium]|nr:PKD domain-containing protein [Thermoanaerobaculia bacterium]
MSIARENRQLRGALVACAILAFALGCSTDSPTAPQQPAPAPPPSPSAAWSIEINVSPKEVPAGSEDPVTVRVRVRRVSDGTSPPNGTTIVLSTNLGEFGSLGSQLTSLVLSLLNGRAEALFFAGDLTGTAVLTARLEGSVGRANLPIVEAIEPVVASFGFQNSDDNFEVTFINTSTGNPTSFLWEFGDGTRSREENPTHRFPGGGDYVVILTASKPESSDSTSQIVPVREDELVASFEATVDDLTVVFRDTSTGDPTSWFWDFGDRATSTQQNPQHTYAREGAYVVTLTVRKKGFDAETNQTVLVNQNLFIRLITPTTGPATGGTLVTIEGQGFGEPLRVFFGDRLGDVQTSGPIVITVLTPPQVLPTEECDSDDDGTADGIRTLDLTVPVTVQVGNTSETIGSGFTYLSPTGTTCVP